MVLEAIRALSDDYHQHQCIGRLAGIAGWGSAERGGGVGEEVLDKTGVGGAVEGNLHESQGRAEGSRTAATSDVKSARAGVMLKVINCYIISGIYGGMFIRFGWVLFSFLFGGFLASGRYYRRLLLVQDK